MRGLKDRVVDELNGGKLAWFLTEVKENPTLELAIRENYVHIYYRGAEALKIEQSAGFKFTSYDKYFIAPELADEYAPLKRDARAQALYQRKFSTLTTAVDSWNNEKNRVAQENQQEIFTENPHLIDLNFLEVASDTHCDLVGVAQDKLVLSPFFQGASSLVDVATRYKLASTVLETKLEDFISSAQNIMTNYVSLGLLDAVLPTSGGAELVFIMVDCDKAAVSQAVSTIQVTTPYKVLFLSKDEKIVDYTKAESL